MTILYFDCQAGISGDMAVGALLDCGVPLQHLRSELDKLGLPAGCCALSCQRTERQHVAALKFDVTVRDQHTQRCYADIDSLIATSALADHVKEKAGRIFRRLAEAEARVHGLPLEEVHFHEVGALDSIVDIVGTAICLDYLGVESVYVSSLPLGSGFVKTAHGRLPVPAPATAELLRGMPLHSECGPGERVTPTGAAIVAALADGFGKRPQMRLDKLGCGAGSQDFGDCPNILRVFLGKSVEAQVNADRVLVLEANIDDSTAEVLGYAMERLLAAGALDVFFTPIQMKKNRPAVMLSLICRQDLLESLSRIVLAETSAIGLRHYQVERTIMERRMVELPTEFGQLRFKQVFDGSGNMLRSTPEYEDCRRVALENGLPCRDVMEKLLCRGALKP